jgi:hypothetical protein
MSPVAKNNTGRQNTLLRGQKRMDEPTRHADATLDRDGLTTIETKRWLLRSHPGEVDYAPVSGSTTTRVASD